MIIIEKRKFFFAKRRKAVDGAGIASTGRRRKAVNFIQQQFRRSLKRNVQVYEW